MEAFGFAPEDFSDDAPLQVWPDLWDAWCVFDAMGTQWRAGAGGVYGLDFNVVRDELEVREIPREDWQEVRELIRYMESIALTEIHRKN